MLKITVGGVEQWDEERQIFLSTKETELCLEHSLVSVSKWESKWHKHFIGNNNLTTEMLTDYIRCMTLTQNVNPEVYYAIPEEQLLKIKEYDGVVGMVYQDENGIFNSNAVLKKVINGKPVVVKE